MTARLIDGTAISAQVREEVREAARWLLAQKYTTVVLYPESK